MVQIQKKFLLLKIQEIIKIKYSVNETDYGIKRQNKDSNVMHIRMKLESQNDYYYYGQMSVMVVGNSLAYYQINAHSENLPVIAKDQRVYLSIGNDIIQNVTFFHSNSNETQQILINYNNNQFKNKQIDQKTLNSLYPQIQVSEQIQEPQLFNRTDMQILTLNGLKEQQKYTIQILNKNLYENLDLQIQLLQPGLKTLLPFIDQYDTALVGQSNDYEMFHSQQESNLLLEVFHCVGRTQLFARESLEGEFDLKERLLKANHLIGVYRVSTTPVYITVKATEGFKDEQQRSQSSYILKSHVLSPNMKIPFELYNPGDNSRITWSNNQDKSVSIKFQSIQCQDTVDCILSNEDEIIEYEYQTWITDTWDEINSLSNCQMDLNQLKQLQTGISQMEDRKKIPYNVLTIKPEDHSKDIEIKIQGLQNQNNNPLYATVVGTLKVQNRNTHKIDQFTYIYNDIEFYQRFENINHDSSNFWVYVLALILITALIIGFKYFQQYKAVQNRLNYEMSDVRNVGQIRMDEF